jgi:hypothetical protein
VKNVTAKNLVLLSVIMTIVAMIFMASSLLYPHPLLLVLAMSVGQGIAIFALVLFLLAVALDLQSAGGELSFPEEPPAEPPAAPSPDAASEHPTATS